MKGIVIKVATITITVKMISPLLDSDSGTIGALRTAGISLVLTVLSINYILYFSDLPKC
jgi:hypothetical protein